MASPRPADGTTIVRLAMEWRAAERVARLCGVTEMRSADNALRQLRAALDTRPEVTHGPDARSGGLTRD